ncbi:MAG: hypothetical protein R3C19_09365 [Planctomycetaceae bacterium]
MPPSIILEVMRILEGEMDLRDETRSLEQARAAIEPDQFHDRANGQSKTQDDLHSRTQNVIRDIRAIPDGDQKFVKEINIITQAAAAMNDATGILKRPDTGPEAIAAETEAIELLLQAKRSNPNGGGGGGGATPGGGGGGTTDEAALALLGPGSNRNATIEERGVRQMTGKTQDALPAEFRDGLDAFFNAVESRR